MNKEYCFVSLILGNCYITTHSLSAVVNSELAMYNNLKLKVLCRNNHQIASLKILQDDNLASSMNTSPYCKTTVKIRGKKHS